MTLEAKYNHLAVENDKYQNWIEKGYFTAGDLSKRPYCIVIPPPNVTGKLHLGHAWDTTLQDILCRYKRLKGYDVCWVAGMDHAGIATQAKVDARLKSEGISRYDIGREKFLERAWEWKEEYASTIRSQWANWVYLWTIVENVLPLMRVYRKRFVKLSLIYIIKV